jgi:hypothetical protein
VESRLSHIETAYESQTELLRRLLDCQEALIEKLNHCQERLNSVGSIEDSSARVTANESLNNFSDGAEGSTIRILSAKSKGKRRLIETNDAAKGPEITGS